TRAARFMLPHPEERPAPQPTKPWLLAADCLLFVGVLYIVEAFGFHYGLQPRDYVVSALAVAAGFLASGWRREPGGGVRIRLARAGIALIVAVPLCAV